MDFSDSRTELVPIALPNGAIAKIEIATTGREDVAFDVKPFKQVTDAIEGIVDAVAVSLHKVRPSKATVKFGLEISVEQGSLVAAIVRGTSKANLEITLEWQPKVD